MAEDVRRGRGRMTEGWESDQTRSMEDQPESSSYTPVAVPDAVLAPAPVKPPQEHDESGSSESGS